MLSRVELKNLESHLKVVDVSRMAVAFGALGAPNRCLLFRSLLKSDNANVGDLAAAVGISEPLASQHLKILLQADLIRKKRVGNHVYYSVNHGDHIVDALQKAVGA